MLAHRRARLLPLCLAVLCATPALADDWTELQEATRRWRVHALDQLEPALKPLRGSSHADVALLANWLHARRLTRQGDGKAALAELEKIRTPLRAISAPALDWAWIEALQADGQTDKAFARTAAFREQYKEFRWAAADLLYSRLSERAAKPEVAAQLALQLYEKSNLHLPRDELLARAARLRKSPELWRRLLLKHPESDYVDEAVRDICGFYRNFHSIRWVGKTLVLRMHQPLTPARLDAVSAEFADLGGAVEVLVAHYANEPKPVRIRLIFQPDALETEPVACPQGDRATLARPPETLDEPTLDRLLGQSPLVRHYGAKVEDLVAVRVHLRVDAHRRHEAWGSVAGGLEAEPGHWVACHLYGPAKSQQGQKERIDAAWP